MPNVESCLEECKTNQVANQTTDLYKQSTLVDIYDPSSRDGWEAIWSHKIKQCPRFVAALVYSHRYDYGEIFG